MAADPDHLPPLHKLGMGQDSVGGRLGGMSVEQVDDLARHELGVGSSLHAYAYMTLRGGHHHLGEVAVSNHDVRQSTAVKVASLTSDS